MATKNLVPRGDQEGKLGLEDRRWLGINAKSGKFLDIQSDELKNSQNNDLLIAGDGISISYVNNEDGNNGAQYTISSTSSGNSNAQVDRIFAGPNDASGSPTQQQAVIAGFDANDSALNKLTFKTNGIDRWFIDNNGHYIPEGAYGELDIGNGTNYVRNFYVSSTSSSGKGIRFVSQDSSQISLSVLDKRLVVSSPASAFGSGTKYDNLLVRKESVKAATKEELTSYVYLNGALTASQPGVVSIDDVTLALNDRILVKNQPIKEHNGIYVVNTLGDANTALRLIRSNDFLENLDFSGVFVECINGTQNSSKIFYASSGQIGSKVGTNDIIWNDFKSSGLTAIVEDLDPHLGADLNLNSKNIKNDQPIQLLPNSVAVNQGIELSKNNLKVNFTSDTTVAIPTLSLASSASKTINIASVDEQSFFTDQNITNTKFTYTFDSASLTQAEKDNAKAFFATEGWVTSQNYLTSVPAGYLTSADLSNYIKTGARATLQTLAITGNPSPSTDVVGISMGSKNIRGLASPVEATDAATKQYVDNIIQSVASVLDTCFVATTANLSGTYNSSTGTLIANANGALPTIDTVDSNSFIEKDSANNIQGTRILVKNQTNKLQNGIYEVVKKGNNNTQWELLRTSDFANGFEASGSFIYVEDGAQNKGNGFICNNDSNADTVNTDNINFVKFSGAGEIVDGAGLSLSGNTLSINVKPAQIEDPTNAGNQIANPDRFIFIDGNDTLDANIPNLVTALNTNGGITASSADTFDWPTTAINTISASDQLVILDKAVAAPDVMKNVSIGSLKSHVLSFTTSDIEYLNDTNNPNTLKIKSEAVDNTHLNKSVITGQSFLLNSNPNPSEVKPDADDLILISDTDDSGNLKKVKYSKFLSDLSVVPDFSSIPQMTENNLFLDDKVLVLDTSDSDKILSLPFSRVARKFVTLESNDVSNQSSNPTSLDPGFTYYFKIPQSASAVDTLYVELSTPATNYDTIEIFLLNTFVNEDDGFSLNKKLSVKLSSNNIVEYNFSDFTKNNSFIFIYIDGAWRTKPKALERKVSKEQVLSPGTANNNYSFDVAFSLERNRFRYKNYYIFNNSESAELNLPKINDVIDQDDLMPGDSVKIYFLHKNVTKRVTINSNNSIFHKLEGNITSNNRAANFTVDQKIIEFNMKDSANADIPYIEISYQKIFDKTTQGGEGVSHPGWLISSPYNAANSDPAFSLPDGEQHQILSYNSDGTTVSPGKIKAVNIDDGAITGGVTGTGNNATPSGPIALSTIVGANIVNSTVTKNKLEQMNNYKVLGSVTNDGQADNDSPNNPVTEVNVLQDITGEIDSNDRQNNLATATAIKRLFATASGAQPFSNSIETNLFTGNTNANDFATFPQRLNLPDLPSSSNVNITIIPRSLPLYGSDKRLMRQDYNEGQLLRAQSNDRLKDQQPTPPNTNDPSTKQGYDLLKTIEQRNRYFGTSQVDLIKAGAELRLPSAQYWHSTFGPNVPVTVTSFVDGSSLNIPAGEPINPIPAVVANSVRSAYHRRWNTYFDALFLKIQPSENDVNAKTNWEGQVPVSSVTIKDGVPTYILHNDYRFGSENFNNVTDGSALGNNSHPASGGNPEKALPYAEINHCFMFYTTTLEQITFQAYVRKYTNGHQIVTAYGSGQNWSQRVIRNIPEIFVWHIVV